MNGKRQRKIPASLRGKSALNVRNEVKQVSALQNINKNKMTVCKIIGCYALNRCSSSLSYKRNKDFWFHEY